MRSHREKAAAVSSLCAGMAPVSESAKSPMIGQRSAYSKSPVRTAVHPKSYSRAAFF